MKKEFKLLYGVLTVMVLAIMTVGATYAYWTASTRSNSGAVKTESTIYSISMGLDALYHGFSVIPMNDTDALKALKNKCKDKYDRGACSAYTIHVYGYNENLDFISGFMDVSVNNMQNLSYMMLRLSDNYDENNCVSVEMSENNFENYCIVKEAAPIGDGIGLSLGDSYDVTGMSSTKFILLFWLSNLEYSQNDIDIGTFEAVVTMQAGNGGEIKGSISNVIIVEDMVGGNDSGSNDENVTEGEQNGVENGE